MEIHESDDELNVNKKELQLLKEQLSKLTEKLEFKENKRTESNNNYSELKKELQDLRNKYIFLLESFVRLQTQEQRKLPIQSSNSIPKKANIISSLGDLQVLSLLKESKATSRQFAVTASQLKQAFTINRSVRTIRNKLNYLEMHNLATSFGKKPKVYFITPSGVELLNEQKRTLIYSNGNLN